MKRLLIATICICTASPSLLAQRSLMIQHSNGNADFFDTSDIRDITFSSDLSQMIIASADTSVVVNRSDVADMKYVDTPTALTVNYEGDKATIQNPFALHGVSVTSKGAHVTINNRNAADELTFELSGTTADGSLLYNGAHKTTFVLNGVNIANPSGAAIDIECGKRIALNLKKNTVNTLADGANGEQKAALYCKGHLEIDKDGTLNITGNTKHALSAKEYIQLKKADGTINILSAKGDGIHCQEYFLANGFNVNIKNAEGDAIQSETSGDEAYEGDYPDGSVRIQGGTINIISSAADAAGIMADTDICINETKSPSSITISMSGNGSKGMKADGKLNIEAGNIDITTTGGRYTESATTRAMGGRPGGGWPGGGWPGGGAAENSNGSSAKGIKAKGAINIDGGNISVFTSGNGAEGMESKTSISINGGNHYLKCYDDAINCSGQIAFNGGIAVCLSTGNDAIDSNYGRSGAIVIGDGVVFAYTTKGSPEMGFDCDNNSYIQIKGNGIGISAGGNQGGSSSATISNASQGYAFISSSISYQKNRYYTVADSSGKNLVTYSFEDNLSSTCSLLTAKGMQKGAACTLKYSTSAPTDAATAFHGIYLGSSAAGTNNVTSFTAK